LNNKFYYTNLGFLFTFINILLVDTRFNIVGIGFGFTAAYFFIKAIRTKV